MSPFFLELGLIVIGGLLLSLVHAFIHREKLSLERAVMGWFVMGTSVVASFFAGIEMMASQSFFMMILVAWNMLMSVLMLLQMGMQKYDVSDENASLPEIIVTSVVLAVILLLSDLYLHLSWAMTLSICIFYSTSIVFIVNLIINYFDLQLPAVLK
jgi:hypothetical protein